MRIISSYPTARGNHRSRRESICKKSRLKPAVLANMNTCRTQILSLTQGVEKSSRRLIGVLAIHETATSIARSAQHEIRYGLAHCLQEVDRQQRLRGRVARGRTRCLATP